MGEASYIILLIAQLLASAAVTLHVLLNKRNVQSAIGWIGLVWLTPFIGALFYFAFGINRVQRRALILRRASKTPREKMERSTSSSEPFGNLKMTVGVLTQQNLMTANISMPLHDGNDAYPLMLAAINSAKTTIALTSYIFRSDKIGHEFIDALANAVQRGVLVRVLIDGFGGG
ncbi:MAG: PLDc N-terminal domain-containing protein, partial [Aestuariivirga sp.]